MKTRSYFVFVTVIVLLLAGCSSPSTGDTVSALSEPDAAAMLESAMHGLNAGDYAAWTRDWSDAMKAAISEAVFLGFRDQFIGQHGEFISIESLELRPGSSDGFVRWSALCNFENGQVRIDFGFRSDGRQIEGVFPEGA